MGMDLGALEDMVSGVTSMRPRLSRRTRRLLQIASGSEKARLQEVVLQASQVLAQEFEKRAPQSLQAQPSLQTPTESSQDQQPQAQAQPSPQAQRESKLVAQAARAHRALARRARSLQRARRRLQRYLRSLQVQEKLSLLLQVSVLVLCLLLAAVLSGIHKAVLQRAGSIKQRHPKLGQINLQQAMHGAGNRLRQLPGTINRALRLIGRRPHRS